MKIRTHRKSDTRSMGKEPGHKFSKLRFRLSHILDNFLSHNNPCFQCNTAITNFLVLHTCKVRVHDVTGQSTIHIIRTQKF